jgi:phosphoglycolate phosphatase
MSAIKRFDLIVFDWDGTLYDSTALIARCIQDACRDVGAPEPTLAQASYVIGLGLVDALRHVAPGLAPERYPDLGARYRHHYLASQDALSLFPGTLEMLQALKARRHRLGVATGKGRRGLDDALAHSQLHGLFDATRTADQTASKPDPTMLLELMDGDTTHDLQLALNAGTPSVAVAFGAHGHESLAGFGALHVAHSTRELHDWLLEHA